jgi:hypothetical protein
MQFSIRPLKLIGSLVVTGHANSVSAHHSYAMFDLDKSVTLEGAVKEFQWTNPHMWVQLLVADPTGGTAKEWSIEGGSPASLSRLGWTRKSLKAGDRVVIIMHPARDGSIAGSLVSVTVNGQKIGNSK